MKKLFASRFQLPVVLAVLLAVFLGGASYQNLLGLQYGNYYPCNGKMMSEADLLAYRDITLETMQAVQAGRGLTYAELCDIPQAKLDRAIFRTNTPKPDHPGEATEFRRMQLENDAGEIPADAYANALTRIDEMRAEQELGAMSAGIENTSWNWIGPGNVGGRVRALAIHPTNTDIMWAGSVSGGIWKTTNGGESWQAQDDFMGNLAVTSIVIDPTDSNTLYAGTGEGFWNGDAIRGAWVFKTTDGGATWNALAINISDPEEQVEYVNRLAISPDGHTLLAATEDGILRSDISTDDEAWSNVNVATGRALDVNFNPSDSSKAVASGQFGSIWYSTDGGGNWSTPTFTGPGSDQTEKFGRIEVAYAPSNPNIIYLSIDTEVNGAEIWKSTNGGQTYARQSTGNTYLGYQGWYDNIIWVDPTNANTIIVGGIDLWRSTDGGVTLTKISEWWNAPDSAHADHHIIVASPDFNGTTNKTVFFGNDGGVYKADDVYTVAGTNGWTELNNNFGVTQFYGAAGNPTTGDIIGGTQDNGTLFYGYGTGTYEKSTEGWIETYGGDGGFSAADPTDSNYFYGEYVGLQIHRSSDAGYSAEEIDGEYWYWNAAAGYWEQRWKDAPYRIDDAMNGTANFIAPFILDPNDSNSILAGGLSLWRTTNAKAATTDTTGPAWYEIKGAVGAEWYNLISAIAVEPGDSNTIWVGHNNGDLYKTTNGGTTWSLIDTGLPNRYLSRIAIDPNDTNIAYVTFTGFNSDNIYKTTDGGASWTDISGSLPMMPIRSVVINPNNSNYIYLGAEFGVFVSENAGASWDVAQDGPAKVSVDELFWMDETPSDATQTTLVAATHGRGLFTASVDTDALHPTPDPAHDDFDSAMDLSQDISDAISGEGGKSMPYTIESGLDTTHATTAGDDPASAECDIAPGTASVWYKYNPGGSTEALTFDTIDSDYDTYLAIWKGDRGNLTPVVCNDDVSESDDSSQVAVSFTGSDSYYIEAGEYNGGLSTESASVGGSLVLTVSDQVGSVSGTVSSGSGPLEGAIVKAAGQTAVTIVDGTYFLDPVPTGDITVTVEATGYPSDSQVATVVNGANTPDVDFVLSVPVDPDVSVTIGGISKGIYPMLSGLESRVESYLGTNGGPVVVKSDNGAKVIASYLQFRRPAFSGPWTGLTQTMGLTDQQISDVYVIPHYDFSDPDTRYNSLQLANFDTKDTSIIVEIGGVARGTFSIPVGSSQNVTFPGVIGGPVVVRSNNGAKIVATLYELKRSKAGIPWSGQTTMMGLPESALSDTYVIPRYNYTLDDLLPYVVFANADDHSTTITVTIGGVVKGTYSMNSGESRVESYLGTNGGPVVVKSDNGAKIIASYLQFRRPAFSGPWTGLTQTMGLTDQQISDVYVIPHYDFSDPDTRYNSLQLANFDTKDTSIIVEIGGVARGTFSIPVGSSQNVTFPGVIGGPVVVRSNNGAKIVATLYELKRAKAGIPWSGQTTMMGLPEAALSDTYVIPRYNYTLNDLLPYVVFAAP